MNTYRHVLSALLVPFALFVFPGASAEDVDSGRIEIELSGLAQSQGNVYIIVYNSEDSWLGKDTTVEQKIVIAEALDGELLRATITLPVGEYAFTIYHDSNDNGKLDTNFIGIPKEPIAMSNNAKGKFGPPKYKDAVFTLGVEPLVQQVVMVAL